MSFVDVLAHPCILRRRAARNRPAEIEVKDITKVDEQSAAMRALGYEAMGEFGITGRRYFRKNSSPEIRTHNVHIFEAGSTEVVRHLAFRDYMIAHPEEAQKYSELKRVLAEKHPQDIESYMDGKDSFIKEIEQRALQWCSSQLSLTTDSYQETS
jgi:GrpB-like predicted nucleotidyltransferase (UPF0157 family)